MEGGGGNAKSNESTRERTGEYREHLEEQWEPDKEQEEHRRAMCRAMGVPESELENTKSTLESNGSQTTNKRSTEKRCVEQGSTRERAGEYREQYEEQRERTGRMLRAKHLNSFAYRSNDQLNERSTRRRSRMFSCKNCDYTTDRRFNLQRHKERMHETDSDTYVSESESESETDSYFTESGEHDPWRATIQASFNFHHDTFKERVEELTTDGFEEDEARAHVYQSMLPAYRQYVTERYIRMIQWYRAVSKDPVGRKIKDTAKRLRDDEDYDYMESWWAAAEKRKFLLDDLLKRYGPPTTED